MRRSILAFSIVGALSVTLTGCTLFSDPNTLSPTPTDIAQWKAQAGLTINPLTAPKASTNTLVRFIGKQPVNKQEACLVNVPVGLAANTKLFWDGDCQSGFASGLGRAILLGPNTHIEAITQYDAKNPTAERVALIRDVKRKETFRGRVSPTRQLGEKETLMEVNGDAFRDLTLRFSQNDTLIEATRSTLTPTEVTTHVVKGALEARHEHDASPLFTNDVTDLWWYGPNDRLTDNVPFRVKRNGHLKTYVRQLGTVRPVALPEDLHFWAPLEKLLTDAKTPLTHAQQARDDAKRLEGDYLAQLARQDRALPTGLDRETFMGILDWSKAFDAKEALTQVKARKDREEAQLRAAKLRALRAEEAAQRAWENRAWFYRSPFVRCYNTTNGLFCAPW